MHTRLFRSKTATNYFVYECNRTANALTNKNKEIFVAKKRGRTRRAVGVRGVLLMLSGRGGRLFSRRARTAPAQYRAFAFTEVFVM